MCFLQLWTFGRSVVKLFQRGGSRDNQAQLIWDNQDSLLMPTQDQTTRLRYHQPQKSSIQLSTVVFSRWSNRCFWCWCFPTFPNYCSTATGPWIELIIVETNANLARPAASLHFGEVVQCRIRLASHAPVDGQMLWNDKSNAIIQHRYKNTLTLKIGPSCSSTTICENTPLETDCKLVKSLLKRVKHSLAVPYTILSRDVEQSKLNIFCNFHWLFVQSS